MKGNIIPPQHQKLRLKYGSKYPIRYSPLCLYHKQNNPIAIYKQSFTQTSLH
ncbi:MAG: hypothetical protein RL711_1645 [Bacteroidota bacterium]|jgi:hypothetical protein